LAEEIVRRLLAYIVEQGPSDGFWYDIHAAVCAKGLKDCKADCL